MPFSLRIITALPAILVMGRLFVFAPAAAMAADWRIEDQSLAQDPNAPFIYERKLVTKESGSSRRIELIWFSSSTHTFSVIDNGPAGSTRYQGLSDAMRKNKAIAGCNGGFFHPDFSPSGLMISGGSSTGRFGEGALLSGVILSSQRGNPYLLRRREYEPNKYAATDLIQSGPFLVDQGEAVAGLSQENSRRRTFVLHDGGGWFALGLSESFTLAELGEILAQASFSPARKIHRALNLDGGTSSGLYLENGASGGVLSVEPIKTVRNFVAIVPKPSGR